MKKCPNCGADNEDIRGICKECGYDMRPKNPDGTVKYTFHTEESRFGFAVASLAFGIIGLLLSCLIIGGIPAIVALVLGIIVVMKSDIKKEKIMAIVGLSCSGIALIMSVFMILVVLASSSPNDNSNTSQADNTGSSTDNESSESTNIIEKVQKENRDDFVSQCTKDFDYKDLIRNENENAGKKIELEVQIKQVLHDGGTTYYRAEANDEYDMWLGDEYVIYDTRKEDKTKILEDDILRVYGIYNGTKDMVRTFTLSEDAIPSVSMYYIEFLDENSVSNGLDEETLNDGTIDTDFGDFYLKYTGYELARNYDGESCIIVYFDYTNLSNESESFSYSTYITAFQNGIECDSTYISGRDNEACNNSHKDVKNGVTLRVAEVFKLNNLTEVEIECKKPGGKAVDTVTIQLQ